MLGASGAARARQTAINWGAIEFAALNNLAKELWPDVRCLIFP